MENYKGGRKMALGKFDYEIGEKVKVVSNCKTSQYIMGGEMKHFFKIGEEVTILSLGNTCLDCENLEKTKTQILDYHQIEKIKEVMKTNFKVGQKYKVVGEDNPHFKKNEIVTLIEFEDDGIHLYQSESGYSFFLWDYDAQLLEEVLKPTPKSFKPKNSEPKLKIGSKWVVTDTGSNHFKVGEEITYIGGGENFDDYGFENSKGDKQWLHLEQFKIKKKPEPKIVHIKSGSLSDFITIGDYTIAVPTGCPIGVSKRHGDDEFNKEVGQDLALARMIKDFGNKGLL